jgi:hypothetical protein
MTKGQSRYLFPPFDQDVAVPPDATASVIGEQVVALTQTNPPREATIHDAVVEKHAQPKQVGGTQKSLEHLISISHFHSLAR